ncbi:MAG TPA: NAD(P)H-dependent oxidoreductase [Gammaproteobacteria bacterium]|jgi:FMN-dependent NADH-azoreductase|nr:NAD(P)H-dependent oxidoreductase [Gammaproteobacteria bacterium]
MQLLHIDSSARQTLSVSRTLTARFAAAWQEANPQGQVVHRDLAAMPLSHVTDQWVRARDTDPAKLTPEQRQTLALSDQLIAELKAADTIVLGAPMYNFGISAALKAWIDLIVRQGHTVDFTVRPPKGLLTGKPLTVIAAQGGQYTPGSPTAAFDFQEPYLRHILGVMGFKDITFIRADRQLYGEEPAAQSRAEAAEKIVQTVGALSTAAA